MKKLIFLMAVLAFTLLYGACGTASKADSDTSNTDSVVVVEEVSIVNDTVLFKSEREIDGMTYLILNLNPARGRVEFADSVIPDIADSTVALCVEAAFTGKLLDKFVTTNVCGDYVIDGVFRKGYDSPINTGFLCTYPDTATFIAPISDCEAWTKKCTGTPGSYLFRQGLIINNGHNVYVGRPIKPERQEIYRAACILEDGTFAIIQSGRKVSFGNFITALINLSVKDALYLDMGKGWNYGWYRITPSDEPVLFFKERGKYQTNWLVVRSN